MTWSNAMRMPAAEVRRRDLEAALSKSVENEQRLRQRLTLLEADAVALRESKSALLESHATEMANVRAELTLACRKSTKLREELRAVDLL